MVYLTGARSETYVAVSAQMLAHWNLHLHYHLVVVYAPRSRGAQGRQVAQQHTAKQQQQQSGMLCQSTCRRTRFLEDRMHDRLRCVIGAFTWKGPGNPLVTGQRQYRECFKSKR